MKLTQGMVAADYIAKIPVQILTENHVRVVGLYLKYYDKTYWEAVETAGIVIVPIFELSAGRALQGAPAGHIDGRNGAIKALQFGQGPPKGIIYTHDTSERNAVVDDYFQAAAEECVARGFSFIHGYWAKNVADAVRALNVPVGMNWAPAAYSWDGGRDPQAQIWQKASTVVPGFPARWDLGTVKIDVELYHPWDTVVVPPTPIIPPIVPGKARKMFTNAENFTLNDIASLQQRDMLKTSVNADTMQANRSFWFIEDNGTVRHITKWSEVVVRGGAEAATPMTTKAILELVDPV